MSLKITLSLSRACARPALVTPYTGFYTSRTCHQNTFSSKISNRKFSITKPSLSTAAAFHSTSHTPLDGPLPDLHILFCGSDEFSAASLNALITARRSGVLPIRSVDVVSRPPKRVGTGLKHVRVLPIVSAARRHKLPVHMIDTFDDWEVPSPAPSPASPSFSSISEVVTESTGAKINLIIAVSFGLLIPARIISSVRYGGLNVHPSMLPDFRGAAPIEWSLLAGCKQTGVSLQTLHPTRFDHGALLLQRHAEFASQNVDEARTQLAKVGAEMLIEGLRKGKFLTQEPSPGEAAELPTVEPFATYLDGVSPVLQRKAPKITPEDRHVRWNEWTAEEVLRRHEVLGALWSECPPYGKGAASSRIKWSAGFTLFEGDDRILDLDEKQPGDIFFHRRGLYVVTGDRKALRAWACTLAGKPERKALEVAQILFPKKGSVLKLS